MFKLNLDGGLVDDGPDLRDLSRLESVENILGERNLPSVNVEAEKRALWGAIEGKPRRHMRWFADEQKDGKMQAGNLLKVVDQHAPIA